MSLCIYTCIGDRAIEITLQKIELQIKLAALRENMFPGFRPHQRKPGKLSHKGWSDYTLPVIETIIK